MITLQYPILSPGIFNVQKKNHYKDALIKLYDYWITPSSLPTLAKAANALLRSLSE